MAREEDSLLVAHRPETGHGDLGLGNSEGGSYNSEDIDCKDRTYRQVMESEEEAEVIKVSGIRGMESGKTLKWLRESIVYQQRFRFNVGEEKLWRGEGSAAVLSRVLIWECLPLPR